MASLLREAGRPGNNPLFFPFTAFALASCLTMRASVAADTVLNIGDPFLAVFGDNSGLLMLMASIAGVLLVVASKVAGRAGRIVIAVEQEIPAMVERCWFPVRRLVTRCTCQRLATMQIIARSHVARLAVGARNRTGRRPV